MGEPLAWTDDDGRCIPEELPIEVTKPMPAPHLALLLEVLDERVTERPTQRTLAVVEDPLIASGTEQDLPRDLYGDVVAPRRANERGEASVPDLRATRWCRHGRIRRATLLVACVLLGFQLLSLSLL